MGLARFLLVQKSGGSVCLFICLFVFNKTKRLFTPKNSNTGSFTYEGQSIIYIHTARGGRAVTREFSFPTITGLPFQFHWR